MHGIVYANTMPHLTSRIYRQVQEGPVLIKAH